MKNKLLVAVVLVVMLALVGCGNGVSKSDLQNQVDTYLEKIAELGSQIDELKEINSELGGGEKLDRVVHRLSDGTPGYYNSVLGKVIFDDILTYETGSQVANTSFISLASKFEMSPSSNWIVKLDGNTTQFNHPRGITGYMNICSTTDIMKPEDLKTSTVDTYVQKMGGRTIASNQLFLDDSLVGWYNEFSIDVNVPVEVEAVETENTEENVEEAVEIEYVKKKMIVKAGSFSQLTNVISFTFMYDDEASSRELVDNLLSTTKYNNRQLKFQ